MTANIDLMNSTFRRHS